MKATAAAAEAAIAPAAPAGAQTVTRILSHPVTRSTERYQCRPSAHAAHASRLLQVVWLVKGILGPGAAGGRCGVSQCAVEVGLSSSRGQRFSRLVLVLLCTSSDIKNAHIRFFCRWMVGWLRVRWPAWNFACFLCAGVHSFRLLLSVHVRCMRVVMTLTYFAAVVRKSLS